MWKSVWVKALVLLLIIGVLAAVFLIPPEPTDEQKLYQVVLDAQEAVNERNPTGLTRLISRDYQDGSGNTRESLVPRISGWLRAGQLVQVVPEVRSVQIQGDLAQMSLNLRISWGGDTTAGETYPVELKLQREGRQWRIISAGGWQRAESDVMNAD